MGLFISFSTGRVFHGLGRTLALGLRRCVHTCVWCVFACVASARSFMNLAARVCSEGACLHMPVMHPGTDSAFHTALWAVSEGASPLCPVL